MADWEIGVVNFQRYHSGAWGTGAVTIGQREELPCRGWFTIVNGDGPIDTGNIFFEIDFGSGYQEWAYAKDVEPGYPLGGGAESAPEIVVRDFVAGHHPGGPFKMRMHLEWTDGTYYGGPIEVTIEEDAAAISREIVARILARSFSATMGTRERTTRLVPRTFETSIGKRSVAARLGARSLDARVVNSAADGVTRSTRIAPRTLSCWIGNRAVTTRLSARSVEARVGRREVAARLESREAECVVVRDG